MKQRENNRFETRFDIMSYVSILRTYQHGVVSSERENTVVIRDYYNTALSQLLTHTFCAPTSGV